MALSEKNLEKLLEEELKEDLEKLLKEELEEKDILDIERYEIEVNLIQPPIFSIYEEFKRGSIYIPKFQRLYRWNIYKASKFIESILLGLPIPPIYVYLDKDNRKVVIDGQQRLLTIYFFKEGKIPQNNEYIKVNTIEELKELMFTRPEKFQDFKLLNVKEEWEGKSYEDLDEKDKNWFDFNYSIWITKISQNKPEEDDISSAFYIFERLNTGGELLTNMELRRALFYGNGNFVSLLEEINEKKEWRKILGRKEPEPKLLDVEILLRVLYLSQNWKNFREPMKERLNNFMRQNSNLDKEKKEALKDLLDRLINLTYSSLGERPFHKFKNRFNIKILDSFMSLTLYYLKKLDKDKLKKIYNKAIKDKEYRNIIETTRISTDEKKLKERFEHLDKIFRENI